MKKVDIQMMLKDNKEDYGSLVGKTNDGKILWKRAVTKEEFEILKQIKLERKAYNKGFKDALRMRGKK